MYTQKVSRPRKQTIPKQNNSIAQLYTTLVFYKVKWTARNIMDHFRVPQGLCIKTSLSAEPLI